VHDDDGDRLVRAVASARVGEPALVADLRVSGADGEQRWFDAVVAKLRTERGGGVIVTCHDVSERKALEQRLAYASAHDTLTGLANRAVFAGELERLATAGRDDYAVLFVDLDRFKPVNDRFGHEAGDAVLREAARRLAGEVREGDTVCRLGGDEFALLLLGVDEARATEVAARILEAMRAGIDVAGTSLEIDATIGVALPTTGAGAGEHPDTVVRRADAAMYRAKDDGRGRYAVA
jgi:diguanylate cyclase (GGDEF)-like protein